ncbi:MAG TPA: hypothetical protein VM639_12795 [Dongiaceae bacterium]|nr:hypothetical protein [Dongiaceae bacterium]
MEKSAIHDLPEKLREPIRKADSIIMSYLAGLQFLISDAARDPEFRNNHLLTYLSQDLLQSAVSVLFLATEGLLNVAKRELRFVLETSVKICKVQQQNYRLPIAEKIETFEKQLKSTNISVNRDIKFEMMREQVVADFCKEVGRLYGAVSEYIHLTPKQILERIDAYENGRTSGHESPEDIEQLNKFAARAFACSLVLLFHSVSPSIAGDWLVEMDGSSTNWFFAKSRFIAEIDSYFDYKAERKYRLEEIQSLRRQRLEF